MAREIPDIYKLKAMELAMADPHSMGVQKALQETYPALAKKLFEGNWIMERMVMSGYNMTNILNYPMCGKCETLALLSGLNQCTCTKTGCNSTTKNPVTLRDWLKYELKNKMPPEELEMLEYKVDRIALSMLQQYRQSLRIEYERHNEQARQKMKAQKLNKVGSESEPMVKHGKITSLTAETVVIPDEVEE